MNLSVVIIYSVVDSTTNAFFLSLRPFDPKRNVSTIVASYWINKMLLLDVSNFIIEKGFL